MENTFNSPENTPAPNSPTNPPLATSGTTGGAGPETAATFPAAVASTPPDTIPAPAASVTTPLAETSAEPTRDPEAAFVSRTDLSHLSRHAEAVRQELAKVIVGQQALAELLLTAILADGHVLLEGVPGVAKTLTAKLLARTLAVPFSRLQFTPDLMPSDVLGTSMFRPNKADFEFRPGPIFASIVLIDEINRAPAKTQSALFEVMEERQVTQDGTRYPVPDPFVVLATQNPIEQEGTYRLPEAQLDRFLFKLNVGYPTLEEEISILQGHHTGFGGTPLDVVRAVLTADDLRGLREQVRRQHVEPKLLEYIARLVGQTRAHKGLYLGASPRASLALLNGAKALSALRGRDFITPEDVQYLASPVLRHRIQLTPEREMEGSTPDDIVKQILQQIEVPR